MCHKYHVKHTSTQWSNLNRLKSGSQRDTKETPTCAVSVHAPQMNAVWWGEEGGTTKVLYTLPRREWMWRVTLSLATVGTAQVRARWQAVYSQNIGDYGVQGCWRGGGGSEVQWHAQVLWGCEAECEFLSEHGTGSGEVRDKQSWRCRAPIVGVVAARPSSVIERSRGTRESPHNGRDLWKRTLFSPVFSL